jgi:hypothetical protein
LDLRNLGRYVAINIPKMAKPKIVKAIARTRLIGIEFTEFPA